jgi:uroporphyrinogen III methyltransferase/synthase
MKTVLEGKKILITRPKDQYEDWATKLSALGAKPLSFPLIEIEPLANSEEIKNTLGKIDNYQWVIFTSVNAAKYFINILQANNIGAPAWRIAAIGSKTAAYLEQNNFPVDFIPDIFTAAQLAESMPDIKGKKILLPRTDLADDELLTGLQKRGAPVDEVTVYRTRKITGRKNELQNLVDTGLDVVTFASPSVVEAFYEMGVDKKNVSIACIGPVTAHKAAEKGLKADIVASIFTADGLTIAMMEYYKSK